MSNTAQLSAKELKNSIKGLLVLGKPPIRNEAGMYYSQLKIEGVNSDILAYTFGKNSEQAHNRAVSMKEAFNETYGKGFDPSKMEDCVNALQAVLNYEQRCADKGEPKIGNGILSIIRDALSSAKIK
jgi:hypothetical protein